MARIAEYTRETRETQITVKLNLDGTGTFQGGYPIGFMSHMLNTFARHGLFDIEIYASGDLEVDQHHLVEDSGITLGSCFAKALGDKRGTQRIGNCLFPMDETLARAVVDLSGRPYLFFDAGISGIPFMSSPLPVPGGTGTAVFQTDTVEDFWHGFVSAANITMHLEILRGRSDHHKIEAIFKAAARSMRDACTIDPRIGNSILSTKGVLA